MISSRAHEWMKRNEERGNVITPLDGATAARRWPMDRVGVIPAKLESLRFVPHFIQFGKKLATI